MTVLPEGCPMADRQRARPTCSSLLCPVLLLVTLIAVAAAGAAPPGVVVRRLPDTFEYLPYQFKHASPSDDARLSYLGADFDNDGISEGVCFSKNNNHDEKFIGVYRYSESQLFSISQINLPVMGGLLGVADVTGDEQEELIYLRQHRGRDVEIIVEEFVFDGDEVSKHPIGGLLWDASASWMENDIWGGGAHLLDAFDHDGDGTRETLILGMCTGIKLYPRGLWEVDWQKGAVVRTLGTGGSPTTDWEFVDANGDGLADVVFGIESPGNGATAGPFVDSRAYIVVADHELSLVWWREVAGYSARVHLAVADLDGDDTKEIAIVIGGHGQQLEDDYSMRLFRLADGEPLARLSYAGPANDIEVAEVDGEARIFVSLADGTLRRYAYRDGEFAEDVRFMNDEGIASVEIVDLGLPSGSPGLIIETAKGTIVACDLDLRPLAAFHTDEGVHIETRIVPSVFPVGESRVPGAIVQTKEQARYLYIDSIWPPALVRRAIDWLRSIASFLIVAVVTLLVAAAVLPRYRRQVVGSLRRRLLPRKRREAELDEFIEQLKTGDHGLLSATKTLRRLAGQFTMLSQHEGEAPPQFSERYAEGLRNAREVGLPAVEGLVASTAQLGLAPLEAAEVKRAIAELHGVIAGVPGKPPNRDGAERVRVQLDRSLATVQRGLSVARGQAERERSSAPVNELERVISSRGAEFRQPGLRLEREGFDALAAVRVLGTPAELTFVFDNLLGNALRAVRGEDEAMIRVAAARSGGSATVTIEDTGKGIASSEHKHVFARGVSEKGGGHGLPRSREILERRGGSIALVRSAPGEGAAFEVKLKVVLDDV